MISFKRVALFWKILMPVAISLASMAIYLGWATHVIRTNNVALQDVRDSQFPRLEALTEIAAGLDRYISTLNNAAAAADESVLAESADIAERIRNRHQRLASLPNGRDDRALGQLSDDYLTLSYSVAHGFVTGNSADADAMQRMSTALAAYQEKLTAAKHSADQNFVSTLDNTITESQQSLIAGIVIGVIA